MIKFFPILLILLYGLGRYHFAVWRTKALLDAKSRPLTDSRLNDRTQRMAQALGLPTIKVNVFDIPQVNGLAAPDGRIFLTQGFLAKYDAGEVTADEMASVIAHELGHVALGHTKRRMIDFTGQNAIFMMLTAFLARFVPLIGPLIANVVAGALGAILSRRDEHEADAYASALLVKAGIGTAPQKSLFRKLEGLVGMQGSGPPAWLRSHPKTTDRIAAIEAREARWASVE